MYNLISSLCAGLIVLNIANIYYSFDVLWKHEYSKDDPLVKEKRRFALGVLLVNIFMFIGCCGWIAWDADLISKSMQYQIGILGRFFAIGGSILFFLTLSLDVEHKKKLIIFCLSAISAIIMYLYKVVS